MRVLFRNAGMRQRSDEAASCATDSGAADRADRCRREPAGCDDGAKARYCKKPKPREQTANAAHCRTDARAFAGVLAGVRGNIVRSVIATCVVGDDADVAMRNTRGLKVLHR